MPDSDSSKNVKSRFFRIAIGALAILGLYWFSQNWHSTMQARSTKELSYTRLHELARQGKVDSVTVQGQELVGQLSPETEIDGHTIQRFRSAMPQGDTSLLDTMQTHGADITVEPPSTSLGGRMLVSLLPWLLIIGLWIWLVRRARQQMNGIPNAPGNFGMTARSKRKIERDEDVKTRFDDVAGLAYAKQDVREVVEFLKEPERFRAVGGEVPRGLLLLGPPGTGKTLLARAVAGEAGVPFFAVNGSEFIELFVGMGASRVRQLFKEAKEEAPAIVFIDELDAVGRARGAGFGGGHDEREQTLNQLLSEMDGFASDQLVVVLAATNRPDVLDPALQRPGRFDRRIVVDRPERDARLEILRVHCRSKPLAEDVSLEAWASETAGFSGADLKSLANEAALHAAKQGRRELAAEDFRAALDKVVLGNPREGKLSTPEKRRIAVHEAGHALIAHQCPHTEPLKRVSILPRGVALGATQQESTEDKHIHTQGELTDRLRVLMGGYAAEKMIFGDLSSGAADDLKKASAIAFQMVAHFGMSETIGPVYHEHKSDHPFLGHRVATDGGTSDATVRTIEEECRRVMSNALGDATKLLDAHREPFDRLVHSLLDRETLEKPDLIELLGQPEQFAPAAAQ